MSWNEIVAFMAVAILLVISPGPNGLLIAKTVPVSGRTAGFSNVWGFVAAFYLHGTLSVLGVSVLLLQSAQAFFWFKMLGAAYLLWIGIKAIMSAFRHNKVFENNEAISDSAILNDTNSDNPNSNTPNPQTTNLQTATVFKAFAEGFLTNALNPKVSLFYLAAYPQFISATDNPYSFYTLVSAHAFLNFIWFSMMVLLITRIKNMTSSTSFSKWLNALTGTVFIGFGAKLALLEKSEYG